MEPKMIWANLASSDLDRTTKFYTDLGFTSKGRSGDISSFLFGNTKFVINFFEKSGLESFSKSKMADLTNQNEVIFSLSAESRDEVDQWHTKVVKAGGKIFLTPQNYQAGYTFGFSDPDGHKFNLLYWPGM